MALPLVWVACAIAAYLYSQQQNVPWATALAAFPAFLLEATFFYILGSERLRARMERLPSVAIATALTLAAVAPYCAASLALGSFRWQSLAWIAAVAAAASFWYCQSNVPFSVSHPFAAVIVPVRGAPSCSTSTRSPQLAPARCP